MPWRWRRSGSRRPSSDGDAVKLLDQILKLRPHNEPVLLDVIRLAAKLHDAGAPACRRWPQSRHAAGSWPEPARQQFARLQQAAKASDLRDAAIQVQFLRNTLVRTLRATGRVSTR